MTELRARKSDASIQHDVMRELKWDTRVDETDLAVEAEQGVVILSGTVGSWGRRLAAAEAAHRVFGVKDVVNDIVVRPPDALGLPDSEIASAVRNALIWDVFVPDSRLESSVSEGVVRLEGVVETWRQREDAERAVHNLEGVRAVVNLIAVEAPEVDPARIRKSIEDALGRQTEREAKRVWVEMQDREVKVFGTVHSWAEKESVVGAAKGTPGVRRVDDRVRIEPTP
jgi:osmotically-inducible protein OsmY